MKEAEQRLLDTQETKAYLGSAGDKRFAELLRPILLGEHAGDERIARPADAGRLRRAAARLRADRDGSTRKRACSSARRPGRTIRRSFARSGSRSVEYPYYERGQGAIRFEDMMAALRRREPGDVALLHGCCHNPTGADLEPGAMARGRDVVAERGLIPLVDIAYQGFGRGLDEDAAACA